MTAVSYIAVDLETTGLDAADDCILEIAWAPLDFYFQKLAPIQSTTIALTPEAMARLNENDYVLNMHIGNGLIADAASGGLALDAAERVVLDSLRAHDFSLGKPTIFGSSVHFDLRFIDAQMPELRKILHYRVLDVTTLMAFSGAADLYADVSRSVAHRAGDDIAWSIETAQRILAATKGRKAA